MTDFSVSPTWPELASALPNCRDVYLPDLDHFIPMRDPALVASCIQEVLHKG
jgi:pimeloyl-ACP methyl ester carboxylesterase